MTLEIRVRRYCKVERINHGNYIWHRWVGGGGGGELSFGSPFSSDIWEPCDVGLDLGLSNWRRGSDGTAVLAHTHVDWRETDNAHIFRADLPGVGKEEVKVQVEDGNILQISGERTLEHVDTNDKWHRVERRCGSFVRRFRLPHNANLDEIKCSLENGVLTVIVPKKETQETSKNVRYIDVD
ncbi:17.4 kDa class I heat shock protein-like [Actinidia eriantha]|uniref:17.4 kDa class I heat shock protein-like n=1 Tax=Actinidia eriantha TaxID=165200 RepID=UPI00258957B6|nr:17.4 kDa class I heat shock protein-like [Actinidia eriantha]XP_057489914.1 17.4 kDa class I heat shock protein-like [Actinidia eriantha]